MTSVRFNVPLVVPGNSAFPYTPAPPKPLPPLPSATYPQAQLIYTSPPQNVPPPVPPAYAPQSKSQPPIRFGSKPLPPPPPASSSSVQYSYNAPVPAAVQYMPVPPTSTIPPHNFYKPEPREGAFEYVPAARPAINKRLVPLPSERAVDPGWDVAPISASGPQMVTKQVGFVDESSYVRYGAGPEIGLGPAPAVALVREPPGPATCNNGLVIASFVLSLVACLCVGFSVLGGLCTLPAVILSSIALCCVRGASTREAARRTLFAKIAMGLAICALLAGVLLAIVYFEMIKERERGSEPPRSRITQALVDNRCISLLSPHYEPKDCTYQYERWSGAERSKLHCCCRNARDRSESSGCIVDGELHVPADCSAKCGPKY